MAKQKVGNPIVNEDKTLIEHKNKNNFFDGLAGDDMVKLVDCKGLKPVVKKFWNFFYHL